MPLEIQTLLRLHGLQHVKDYLKLDVKEKDNLVLLKYRQLDADWTKTALYDCRGIILDRTNADWNIVSFPYNKFFNIGEGYCAKIDWDTAKFYEKADGSLINIYFYNGIWNVQTSGTIDGLFRTSGGEMTFAELFWFSVKEMYSSVENFIARLDVNNNYMFELCTPYNIVVTQHNDFTVKLHGVRNMQTLKYVDIETIDLVRVKTYDLKHVDDMIAQFEDMSWQEEGFVVCDANFNRAKCKNPKYVAVHHVATGVSPYAIMNVIKTNEIDEYLVYFTAREEELRELMRKWKAEEAMLTELYNKVYIENLNVYEEKSRIPREGVTETDVLRSAELNKEFAMRVREHVPKVYHGVMFALRNKSIASIHEGMCTFSDGYWFTKFNGPLKK